MAQTFDDTELLGRVDNDREFLAETVRMLTTDGPPMLVQIRSAVRAGAAPDVARHAHALKGMIANFCAPDARASAADVERMGREGQLHGAPAAVDALAQRFGDLVVELERFVEAKA